MLQSPKSGKNTNEKRRHKYNTFNNNKLRKSLKIRVFATNFALGGLHASYERHFVKKIFCVLIKGLTNLKFFQNMPHSRAILYLIYIGQPSSSDV